MGNSMSYRMALMPVRILKVTSVIETFLIPTPQKYSIGPILTKNVYTEIRKNTQL